MERLAFFIILFAVVTAVLQKFLFRTGLLKNDTIHVLSDSILAIAVYDYNYDWENAVRKILNNSVYKANVTIGLVIKCKKSNQKISIPIDLQSQVHVMYVNKRKKYTINDYIEKFYNNETYIAIFSYSFPCKEWDYNCVSFINKNRLITACPMCKDTATFPTIKNDKEVLRNDKLLRMKSMMGTVTKSVCLCENFIFGLYGVLNSINFSNSLIEESLNTKHKLITFCFPIVEGKYIKSYSCNNKNKKYSKNMFWGLTKYPTDTECIAKYGSVESANLKIEFGNNY